MKQIQLSVCCIVFHGSLQSRDRRRIRVIQTGHKHQIPRVHQVHFHSQSKQSHGFIDFSKRLCFKDQREKKTFQNFLRILSKRLEAKHSVNREVGQS